MIFVLYNYDLWKIVKMEINHRSGDREKKKLPLSSRSEAGNQGYVLSYTYDIYKK